MRTNKRFKLGGLVLVLLILGMVLLECEPQDEPLPPVGAYLEFTPEFWQALDGMFETGKMIPPSHFGVIHYWKAHKRDSYTLDTALIEITDKTLIKAVDTIPDDTAQLVLEASYIPPTGFYCDSLTQVLLYGMIDARMIFYGYSKLFSMVLTESKPKRISVKIGVIDNKE